MNRSATVSAIALSCLITAAASAAASPAWGEWSDAVDVDDLTGGAINTAATEGCPFIAKDGRVMFLASNRMPGGQGNLDIWVSTRESVDDPWGPPVNPGSPVNTTANDFCPTLAADGHSFFFASSRPGHCGMAPNADIYTTRFSRIHGFADEVRHLGCEVNSPYDEHSPFPTNLQGSGPQLFYSSARPSSVDPSTASHDLYMSPQLTSGQWGAGELIAGVNTGAMDGQPNVSRDGLELYFYSNRDGDNDIYVADRTQPGDPWSDPRNLGPTVNSGAAESRPSLSWDMTTLYFGSTRNGSSDIFVTVRPRG